MACGPNWVVKNVNNINIELGNFYPVYLQSCQMFDSEDATTMNCQYCETAKYKNR